MVVKFHCMSLGLKGLKQLFQTEETKRTFRFPLIEFLVLFANPMIPASSRLFRSLSCKTLPVTFLFLLINSSKAVFLSDGRFTQSITNGINEVVINKPPDRRNAGSYDPNLSAMRPIT